MTTSLVQTKETGVRAYAVRRPVTALLTVILSVGLPLLTLAVLLGIATEPFLLVIVFGGLAGGSLLITRWAEGPAGVRELLGRLLRWRFGVGLWLTIVFAMPLLTLGVAAVTGTLRAPPKGWAFEAGFYLFLVFVFGALLLNLWEELGWTGFVQARLMRRHGLLVGSLLTAVPFAAVHVPLAFEAGWTWSSAAVELIAIVGMAPFVRYLVGTLYLDTAGSLLAVGLMHASYNASSQLGAAPGGWQFLPALALLTITVALVRRRQRPQD
jgi:membrane protease YdiL (CAAX protease family)